MKNSVKYFIYGFSRNSQNPLDPRFKISSLSNLNTELILEHRYGGLIFFVDDEDKPYIFLNDLETPISLGSLISSGDIKGFDLPDYSYITSNLNTTNPTLGSIVTVFPLGVSFMFDGSKWKYYHGTYNVTNDAQFNSIDVTLRSEGKLIIMGGTRYIIDSNLLKSTEVIVATSIPVTPQKNRYYSINDILYYSIGGSIYRLSEKFKLITNQSLIVLNDSNISTNLNVITHNLNSIYISVYFRINLNNGINTISRMEEVNYVTIDSNTIKILSDFVITGDLIIVGK